MRANYILALIAVVCYSIIAYAIPRSEFTSFAALFTILFASYGYWSYRAKDLFEASKIKLFIGAAILLRIVFIFATPELSDDFYRYLWDGRLLSHGVNPFRYLPSELVTQEIYQKAHLDQLFEQLNSPNYYAVYPPVTQFIFAFVAFCFPSNVFGALVLMHLIVLAFEVGTILILIKLLQKLGKPIHLAFLYAYNPLVILELSGNLHTEYCMIFFMILALYLLVEKKYHQSALSFSMAVCAKLLPLMFMPLMLHRLWFKKGFVYCAIVGIVSLLFFVPFYDLELLLKIRESMGLYFAHFEFNASVFYVMRYWVLNEYWYWWEYHDYFRDIGIIENLLRMDLYVVLRKVLPVFDVFIILYFSLKKQVRVSSNGFFLGFLWIYSTHYFLATTVHPWYITPLVLFTVLTAFRYALWWTFLIGLSYISYQSEVFQEQSWVIGIEYIMVFGILLYERRSKALD